VLGSVGIKKERGLTVWGSRRERNQKKTGTDLRPKRARRKTGGNLEQAEFGTNLEGGREGER